eukprot:CAMPEP_0114649480 /NCGR_PEP_ID=MMETSP0191-20121206/7072_1 /TAXON_ID=126664 /ORGANISM="Sorites sp." /LENGTH=94 /DNA_ID=CAMNT_0001863109 /DNA_START=51 /DNA_END=335 /DNA_ORIENTATION=-
MSSHCVSKMLVALLLATAQTSAQETNNVSAKQMAQDFTERATSPSALRPKANPCYVARQPTVRSLDIRPNRATVECGKGSVPQSSSVHLQDANL